MGNEYKFGKVYLDGRQEFEVVKAFSKLSEEEIKAIQDKQEKGTLTGEDFQRAIDRSVANSVEENIMESLSDFEMMMRQREPIPKTYEETIPVKPIVLTDDLFSTQSMLVSTPIKITGKGAGDIFNSTVNDTANQIVCDNGNPTTRIEMYKDEMVNRLIAVQTMDDYAEFAEWYRWYLEEDKSTLSAMSKVNTFILVVLLEIQVFQTYNVDLAELREEVTADKYPASTDAEFTEQAIAIANYTSRFISQRISDFKSDEMTMEEFIQRRADNFNAIFEAVL